MKTLNNQNYHEFIEDAQLRCAIYNVIERNVNPEDIKKEFGNELFIKLMVALKTINGEFDDNRN